MATTNYDYDMDVVLHCYAAMSSLDYLHDTIETLYCETTTATDKTKAKIEKSRKLYYETVELLGTLREKADDKVMETIRQNRAKQS